MNFYHNDIWPVALISLILTGLVFGFIELNNPGKRRLVRIFALAVGLFAVFCLITKPSFRGASTGSTATVITNGTPSDQIAKIEGAAGNEDIFRADLSWYDIPEWDLYDSIVLTGNGLPGSMIEGITNTMVTWQKPPRIPGIQQITIPEITWKDREFSIIGTTNDPALVLTATAGTNRDTLLLNQGSFMASFIFKTAGRNMVNIHAYDSSGNLIDRYTIGLDTRTSRPLKFLFLSGFPRFENRFLQEHLAREGHEITSRSEVSRNLYAWEFLNTARDRSDPFGRLGSFDMIVVNEEVISNLDRTRREELLKAVNEGLGVLVTAPEKSMVNGTFMKIQLPEYQSTKRTFITIGSTRLSILPYIFAQNPDATFSTVELEKGKMTFSLIPETYPMLLSGDSTAYRNLWASLIFNTARPKEENAVVFPVLWERMTDVKMPVGVYARSIPTLLINHSRVALERDKLIPEKWSGYYWPSDSGWYQAEIQTPNDTIRRNFYVPGKNSWATLRQQSAWSNTEHFLNTSTRSVTESQPARSVSPAWWLLLFLFSFGFLWLEPRI